MGYADPAQLSELNAVIDERAEANGRGPAGGAADVQRLRSLRHRRRLPPGHGGRLGRAAGRARDRRGHRARSSSAPTTPTRAPVRRSRWPRRCATRSTPSEPCGAGAGRRPVPEDRAHQSRPRPRPRPRLAVTPTPDDGTRLTGQLPWDETTRPRYPEPADAAYTERAAGRPAAPRRHPRPPAGRARPAARRRRPGAPAALTGRRGPVGDQHDDDAPEQLDARAPTASPYCRIVTGHHTLEDRSMFPHLRQARPGGRLRSSTGCRGARGHRRRARAGRPRAGRPRRRPTHGAASGALEELQRALDLLTDTLLSHLVLRGARAAAPPGAARDGLNDDRRLHGQSMARYGVAAPEEAMDTRLAGYSGGLPQPSVTFSVSFRGGAGERRAPHDEYAARSPRPA